MFRITLRKEKKLIYHQSATVSAEEGRKRERGIGTCSFKGYFGILSLLLLLSVVRPPNVPPARRPAGVGLRKTKDLFPTIHSLTPLGNRVNPLASQPQPPPPRRRWRTSVAGNKPGLS